MKLFDVSIHVSDTANGAQLIYFAEGAKVVRNEEKQLFDTVVKITAIPFLKWVTIHFDNGTKLHYRRYNFIYSTK